MYMHMSLLLARSCKRFVTFGALLDCSRRAPPPGPRALRRARRTRRGPAMGPRACYVRDVRGAGGVGAASPLCVRYGPCHVIQMHVLATSTC